MDFSAHSKVMDLETAVSNFVRNGDHISLGGFTINRNPMAAVHEIIRQHIKGLHVYAHSNGQAIDTLAGAGCIGKLEIAYGGAGRFSPTCLRFKAAVESGRLIVEDYSNYQMTLRFMAGAMGVPFLPTRSGLGSDIIRKWGFSATDRAADPKLPDKKIHVADNPFGTWGNTEKLVFVPAIYPDITILHVQTADTQGTVRIKGLPFSDIYQANASKRLIVTCEELVPPDNLRQHPDHNHIPFFRVDAVVHVPYGAYPTACYGHYDYDPDFLKASASAALDDATYENHLARYVYGVKNHEAFLSLIGQEQLDRIAANPDTGYAVGLDRK
jgi:glutaconate CoA-transferase subunit A